MSNMSYFRFENTEKDLEDCYEHLGDDTSDMSEREREARARLIILCENIVADYGEGE